MGFLKKSSINMAWPMILHGVQNALIKALVAILPLGMMPGIY
jgi:hypothetical protein